VHCSYCGKEIGALRLLRDREFCSPSHRKSYKQRLDRVVSQISSEDNTAPPPLGRFLTELRPAPGNLLCAMEPWQPATAHTFHGFWQWTLGIPALAHQKPVDLPERAAAIAGSRPVLEVASLELLNADWVPQAAYPALDLAAVLDAAEIADAGLPPETEVTPPVCDAFAAVPAAEPVERWLERIQAAPLAFAATAVVPPLEGMMSAVLYAPHRCDAALSVPPAEPVTAWIECSAAAEPVGFARSLQLPALGMEPVSNTPSLGEVLPVPPAEPVTAWIEYAAASAPLAFGRQLQLPAAAIIGAPASELCGYLPVPAAEPVAAWLSVAASPVAVNFPHALALPAALEAVLTADSGTSMVQPERERENDFAEITAAPVTAFPAAAGAAPIAFGSILQLPAALALASPTEPAAAATFAEAAFAPANLTALTAPIEPLATVCGLRLPATLDLLAPAALPLAGESQSAVALAGAAASPAYSANSGDRTAKPELPAFHISADLPDLEEAFEPPPLCERVIAGPGPEPVWSFLAVSSADALLAVIPTARPVLAAHIIPTHVPLCTATLPGLQAEPVMAGVWPRIAETPIERIDGALVHTLPQVTVSHAVLELTAAGSVYGPAAEPVETLLVPTSAAEICASLALQLPAISVIAATVLEASLALPAAGQQAEPAAAWVEAAVSDRVAASRPVVLQAFEVEGDSATAIPVPELPALAAHAAEPAPAEPVAIELRPLSTVQLSLPEQRHQRPLPGVPQPGMLALEYHMHRTRSETYARPEWKSVTYQPQAPEFALRAILENLDEMIKPKAPPAGVFLVKNRGQLINRSKVMEHVLRIAAAVLIVTSIWGGAAALKNARRVSVRPPEETAFATPNRVLTPESQKVFNKASEGKGPVNWVRHTVANRASVQVAEDFQGGMQRWTSAGGATPANWRRNADGYAVTGALALFRPTAKFEDYKLEFFGQIENKSIGWVVRAKDEKNYHAMKFTTIERGLRPIIAMVHYTVVDGVAGRRTQTPLNVMVHNNRPFQVAVTVRGKHFVTEVDGEEVDTFREDALPMGGVGFFSDAGETARLYWARVTKNDDWLGHVCAFLSGGESQATADLRLPAFPGEAPAPWTPGGDPAILTAAWIGVPSFRRTQSSLRRKRCNR
jgi:hypothetical protein